MDALKIHGQRPLHGVVQVSGAKNAALPIMAAAILADGPVTLEGIPAVRDVEMMSRVLYRLGLHVSRGRDDRVRLETVDSRCTTAPHRWVRRMRAGFCVLGPLLARRGAAVVAMPGGCRIGDRPVDLHLKGLAALGARFQVQRGYIVATADRLRGAVVDMHGPRGATVTGTANVLSAAVLAEGQTRILGAACEPEVVDLGRFLIGLGARIEGLGTDELTIVGVDRLSGGVHRVIPDRIEAATLLLAVCAAGGKVTVRDVCVDHLTEVLDAVRRLGADVWTRGNEATIERRRPLSPADFTALPYPGLPTDVQALITSVLLTAHGRSVVRDLVFPERFAHLAELRRFGATVQAQGDSAVVRGVQRLSGAEVFAADLRGAAALVIAALTAEGESTVHRIQHLDRGYCRLDLKLASLGAHIHRLGAARRSASPPLAAWNLAS